MQGTPVDWNIVVNGAWNRSILTPQGIASRMFGLPVGTPVEVEVTFDQAPSIRVAHDTIRVLPLDGRLLVDLAGEKNVDRLRQAAAYVIRALQELPQTPVSAVGVNIKYQYPALPDELLELVRSRLDNKLTDVGRNIRDRFARRAVLRDPGVVNIEIIERGDASGLVSFNFHLVTDQTVTAAHWLENASAMYDESVELLTLLETKGDELHE